MKFLLFSFFLLTIANGIIYSNRHSFQYIKYSTSSELYSHCNESCLVKWKRFLEPFPSSEMAEAKQILEPLKLDTASALSKIKQIGHLIYSKFQFQNGFPQPIIHSSTPVVQYKMLAADTAQKLWCGTYTQMFNYFCWSQNVVCRSIEIMRPGDHHVINECFLPELNKWILVDLTMGILYAEANGSLLNAQDFLTCLESNRPITVTRAESLEKQLLSAFAKKNAVSGYYNSAYPFFYYHTTSTNSVYTTASKIKRYFLPEHWYEIYSKTKKIPIFFYVKLSVLLIWLILGSIIIFKHFHDRSKRIKEKFWR